ncbi:MAG TPA: hypothetical protein VF179_03335 [Thermoanaerobaculia bacterium]|nr:hypothetical protein [Thermoanaerobaculia bacterium]
MRYLLAFLAGFLATLVFHQGLLAILHRAGASPRAAYSMAPAGPLHVPQVLSLAFWGGVWGIALWLAVGRWEGASFWLGAIVFGALLPSVVALFIVFPLKGQPVAGGWKPAILVGALLLNGAWGLGTAAFLRLTELLLPTAAP